MVKCVLHCAQSVKLLLPVANCMGKSITTLLKMNPNQGPSLPLTLSYTGAHRAIMMFAGYKKSDISRSCSEKYWGYDQSKNIIRHIS